MAKHFSYRAFIRGLENLYAKFALTVLHKRISNYQDKTIPKEHARDIKTPLMKFMDTTVSQAVKGNITDDEATTGEVIQPHHPAAQHTGHHVLSRERIDELSKYFKERNKGAELHQPIKKQLEHSVWEHIHAALRCARKGDERNSKMHVDIVDSACKELAHYMDEEPYLEFIGHVEEHLSTLKSGQIDKDA